MSENTIFFVVPPSASAGAVADAALAHALALHRRGRDVELITGSEELSRRAAAYGLQSRCSPAFRSSLASLTSWKGLRSGFALRRNPPARVIHATGGLWFGLWPFVPQARQCAVFYSETLKSQARFLNWLAVTSGFAEKLSKRAAKMRKPRAVAVIRNGLLPDREILPRIARPNTNQAEADQAAVDEPETNQLVVGTIMAHRPEKRTDLLFQAIAGLPDELRARIRVKCGGDGPERDYLETLAWALRIADRVEWLGGTTDRQAFFQGIDLFVLPSGREALDLVLLEAGFAGCPIIATRTNGAEELLCGGTYGTLVPRGHAEALTAAIIAFDKKSVERAEHAKAIAAVFRKRYGLDEVGRILEDALGLPVKETETKEETGSV
ncbi:MAG: glycosyltransferase [Hyphomicrobiales bacterium]|nr:glycosyltransferase [Hyphomicrobiales bacterium]